MIPCPVSAVDCVQPALQHTRQQLFTRFRFGQWSRLALVGILAAELHVGGCNFGNLGGYFLRVPHKSGNGFLTFSRLPLVWPPFNPGHISEHIAPLFALIVVGIFVAIVLAFVFLYINSVFRFILFDSVLRRQCAISEGWESGIAPEAGSFCGNWRSRLSPGCFCWSWLAFRWPWRSLRVG